MEQLVDSCGISKAMASVPLVFEEPVYGNNQLTFTDFMAPGTNHLCFSRKVLVVDSLWHFANFLLVRYHPDDCALDGPGLLCHDHHYREE